MGVTLRIEFIARQAKRAEMNFNPTEIRDPGLKISQVIIKSNLQAIYHMGLQFHLGLAG